MSSMDREKSVATAEEGPDKAAEAGPADFTTTLDGAGEGAADDE